MTPRLANIDLLNNCDAFPDPDKDPIGFEKLTGELYTLVWQDDEGSFPIGYLPISVLDVLVKTPTVVRGRMDVNPADKTIMLFHKPQTYEERTKLVAQLTSYWRKNQTFRSLKGWRDELWPVYGRHSELLFSMERAAMGLFGTTRYGVHMTAFIRRRDASSKYDFRIWVPKRSPSKSTYPGMLDNTVAGGLMTNEDPFECVIREADEEASLPEQVMRERARDVGIVTYIFITDERSGGEPGYIYPECQWIYDLELPSDGSVVPAPKDGEVESFSLRTVEEIQEQLAQGLWKPNCAVVMLDFLLRHGIYTSENEPYYDELCERTHRYIGFPGPHHEFHQPHAKRA
ncbi:NUDIX hydrolase domain-like protein [Podospora didyma]|uniref:NUDIX hydrolase domain-like protein n=1 Tax=Podospora didyma TaxID=330526 RepID=A0AAE0P058_9PEZI|nr:NUDIX hydrolase domain-like protein [Podospora didyma]